MDSLTINYFLRQMGKTQGDIADECGVSTQYISHVITGRRNGPKTIPIQEAVARALNRKREDVFPDSKKKPREGTSR